MTVITHNQINTPYYILYKNHIFLKKIYNINYYKFK